MGYENLLLEADYNSVEVYEKNMTPTIKGLYSDNIIWINKHFNSNEKHCVLAEELGHYFTSYGNILDQTTIVNRKQEKKARYWAHKRLVPLRKIVQAHKAGIKNRYELAEFLNVTEAFLNESIERYKEVYGLSKDVDGLTVCFEPLGVLEFFE